MHVADRLPGFGYGAFTYPNPYLHAVTMAGEVPGFSARLLMIPELQLGVVVLVNRKDPSLAVSVFDSLLVRVGGGSSSGPPRNACMRDSAVTSAAATGRTSQQEREQIVGTYRSNVYERGSFLKIAALLGPTLTLTPDTGNSLVMVSPIDDRASRMFPAGDGTWHSRAGDCLTAVSNDGDAMLALTTRFAGPVMLERIKWYDSAPVVVPLAALALLTLLVVLIVQLANSIRRRRTMAPRSVRILANSLAIGHLAFVVLFAVGLAQLAIIYDDRFATGIPTWYTAVLQLPVALWAMTAVLAALVLRNRQRGKGSVFVLFASVVLAVVQWQWHMHSL
jgi:hypothetical protein